MNRLRKITAIAFTALVAFAPSGTRYILRTGSIDGNPVEPGTVSVFGMQLLALAFIALVFWTEGRRKVMAALETPSSTAGLALTLVALLSVTRAQDPLAGLTAASFVATGVALFVAITLFRPDPHETIVSFVGGAVFQFGLGAWQFYTQNAFASKWLGMAAHSADELGAFVVETASGRWLRAYGSLAHPNVFGLYVGVGLLAAIGLAAFRGHGKHLKYFAFQPLIAAGLLFSFSKSAILAVGVGFLWMVVSAYGSEAAPRFRRVLVPSFMIIAMTFAALGVLYAEPLRTRAAGEGRLESRSVSERVSQIDDAVALFVRHPVLGVGIGDMPLALRREVDPNREWWRYQYVHNVPALVAVETGILGLAAWIAFVAATVAVMARRLRKRTEASTGVTVYASAFVALLVASLFDHFLWSSWFGQLLFWTIAGLLHAAYQGIEKTR